jgi:cytochrome c biogenesis protein CcdA/glutaredoxin
LFPAAVFSQSEEPVEILLFFSEHCRPCQEIKKDFLPRIKEKYRGKIRIEELDITQPANYLRLLELQDKYKSHTEKIFTPTIFIDGKFLVGSREVRKYFEIYIDSVLSRRGFSPSRLLKDERGKVKASLREKLLLGTIARGVTSADLISRFKLISPLAVITAGLIDGINPCAFTVIIFFISFLALQGYGRRQVLAIGFSFVLAVFLIYVLIGLGLFSFLYKLKAYWLVVKIVYTAGALLCFILAGLALFDFIKFRRTGQTQDLILQLPPGLKQRIQRIIGFYYRKDKGKESKDKKRNILRLICTAFVVGCFVSLFEAVCTGQVYLPTIVFVLKTTPLKLKAFLYLVIYNLMFILPLCLILLFALWGVTSAQFGEFARRHIGTIKILMMVLFLSLGLFLIWQ